MRDDDVANSYEFSAFDNLLDKCHCFGVVLHFLRALRCMMQRSPFPILWFYKIYCLWDKAYAWFICVLCAYKIFSHKFDLHVQRRNSVSGTQRYRIEWNNWKCHHSQPAVGGTKNRSKLFKSDHSVCSCGEAIHNKICFSSDFAYKKSSLNQIRLCDIYLWLYWFPNDEQDGKNVELIRLLEKSDSFHRLLPA